MLKRLFFFYKIIYDNEKIKFLNKNMIKKFFCWIVFVKFCCFKIVEYIFIVIKMIE